jgi:hypothetical protein
VIVVVLLVFLLALGGACLLFAPLIQRAALRMMGRPRNRLSAWSSKVASSRTSLLSIRASGVLCIAAACALWFASSRSSARAEATVRARVVELTDAISTALPTGSTPAQVVAFLDAQHLGHSEFDEKTRSVFASTAEEQVNFLIRTRVFIEFDFDEMAHMTSFSVRQGVTGP